MSNFYISDTHLGHNNIIKHCNRPFETADIMDRTIIQNWNSVVTDRDTVYILGDIVFSKGVKEPAEYLSKLKGKKIAIVGNHDYDISRNREKYMENNLLDAVYNYFEIKEIVNGKSRKVVMSHYPIVEWNGFFRGSIHLYGHIHNNIENTAFKIMSNIENAYNVSADILDFTPRTLEEVIEYNQIFKELMLGYSEMEYTMKLIFSPEADMADMEERIEDICQRSGSIILEIKDNVIIYGADVYEKFGPAFIYLRYEDEVKRQIVDAIWSSKHEGSHSCKRNILKKLED